MNSKELEDFVKSNAYLRDFVKGVFAIDTLPQHVTQYPSAYIVNTDPMVLPGKQWILVILRIKPNFTTA